MEKTKFSEFAERMYKATGGMGTTNQSEFVRKLFDNVISDNISLVLDEIEDSTYKSYYGGFTNISGISKKIYDNIDTKKFEQYLISMPKEIVEKIVDAFKEYIPNINKNNAPKKVAKYFAEIIHEAASLKAKKASKSFSNELNLDSIEIPEFRFTDEIPYSEDDIQLLSEFTTDYDEIIMKLISGNYINALISLELPKIIQKLYLEKWNVKAVQFDDPNLKSYAFGLLGELEKLSNSFISGNKSTSSLRKIRTKVRNYYVKLHPELFDCCCPYDVFIDDWNDGEI